MSKFSYYNNQFLDAMRQKADPLADEVVSALYENGFNPAGQKSFLQFEYNHQELPADFPKPLKQFFNEVRHEDATSENATIKTGSTIFQQYGPELMAILGALSLPYCYASGKGVQVLHLSERIKNNPGKRLLETATFILDVCHPAAFEPEGKAFRSIAKVRLMHAAIRFHAQKSPLWKPEWGVPINQEDMAGTNLAFSLIALRGLRKLGHSISAEEAQEFIRMWSIIGKMLGIRAELLPDNNKEAFVLEKQIKDRTFYATKEGKDLTKILLDHLKSETNNSIPVEKLVYYLLGKEVAEIVGLEQTNSRGGLVALIKITNRLKSLSVNKYAYFESIKAYNIQQLKLQRKQTPLAPYRFLKNLRD